MNEPVETFEVNGKTVSLYHDDDPRSPREHDNLGHIVCWHRRYNLGDEQVRPGEHASCIEDFEQWLREERGAFIVLPIYIYDHGSITVTARYETYLTLMVSWLRPATSDHTFLGRPVANSTDA